MKVVIILGLFIVALVVVCGLMIKALKNQKEKNKTLNEEIRNLRKEKEQVQLKNYELTQQVDQYKAAQKKAEKAKETAAKAKKQVEVANEKLKNDSVSSLDTAITILSNNKKTRKSKG